MSNEQIPLWRLGNAFLSAEGKPAKCIAHNGQVVILHAIEHHEGKPAKCKEAIDWYPGETLENVFEELKQLNLDMLERVLA